MFIQTNGYWDNSDVNGSGSNTPIGAVYEAQGQDIASYLWSTGDNFNYFCFTYRLQLI